MQRKKLYCMPEIVLVTIEQDVLALSTNLDDYGKSPWEKEILE